MKTLVKVLALIFLGPISNLVAEYIKQHLTKPYISLMHHVRGLFLIGFCTFLSILVMLGSFVLFHIALYLYLPWSINDKALLLLILSGIYLLGALLVILWLLSPKNWLKIGQEKHLAAFDHKKE